MAKEKYVKPVVETLFGPPAYGQEVVPCKPTRPCRPCVPPCGPTPCRPWPCKPRPCRPGPCKPGPCVVPCPVVLPEPK
ncbi:MAG: hypothetical protein DRP94_03485 [Candidatus Latescibacterota bacterium]|nr:MAG: hypothetical protein DRP94_03485 [Candidatus Latescibacterota bacterium]RKY73495.1 MAG: hypothetical protein DRQ14_04050 [Candidatus Latescibacterota bacterium]HDI00125.1 hypothetical protein [Bacillota bacterium]